MGCLPAVPHLNWIISQHGSMILVGKSCGSWPDWPIVIIDPTNPHAHPIHFNSPILTLFLYIISMHPTDWERIKKKEKEIDIARVRLSSNAWFHAKVDNIGSYSKKLQR
ncbi:hypothetical protein L6164_025610 [Bauhinia variegata]|uniref:Uncharacterized protein n=1 Tax=Bauhinia variegata TaxID=167791 RepID=A0ACB9M110_BAUVA|nr:hypothetical protein L6164_025610 [Bauhinia variegata]